MITADCHTHTDFSSDSKSSPVAMAEGAIHRGLKTICITDHFDYLYPVSPEYGLTFIFDIDEYMKAMKDLKESFRDRIKINIGIELGTRNEADISPEVCAEYKRLTDNYKFDFVIGSTHVARKADPYYPEFWEGYTKNRIIEEFFKAQYENLQIYDMTDSVGHLDYVIRYNPDGDKSYRVSDFSDIIDELLRYLIRKGKALECNSSGLKYGLGELHPKQEILKRYRELGGELITIGSDGHKPEHLAYAFDRTEEMLISAGFRYYTVYTERKPEFFRLGV